jgi:hypothetical protein
MNPDTSNMQANDESSPPAGLKIYDPKYGWSNLNNHNGNAHSFVAPEQKSKNDIPNSDIFIKNLSESLNDFLKLTDTDGYGELNRHWKTIADLIALLGTHIERQTTLKNELEDNQKKIEDVKKDLVHYAKQSEDVERKFLVVSKVRSQLTSVLSEKIIQELR